MFVDNFICCISGQKAIEVSKYPMSVLGGKSKPKLKNLKPFIKVGISYTYPKSSLLLQ